MVIGWGVVVGGFGGISPTFLCRVKKKMMEYPPRGIAGFVRNCGRRHGEERRDRQTEKSALGLSPIFSAFHRVRFSSCSEGSTRDLINKRGMDYQLIF